ncbi:MAG: murein L,D-transpeptidase family protein [Hyphomicrobiales bacterium]
MMISRLVISILIVNLGLFQSDSFKEKQLEYSRVRQAYKDKEQNMLSLLKSKSIDRDKLKVYLRAFKEEEQIELWGKNSKDQKYQLIKTYEVCRSSGTLGPKRKEGDRQVPEGFYHINRFNPYSNFYLSLGINYPNRSDKVLGVKGKLGGDIFIHGSCVTVGCLPITDDQIKELYIFCVEAKNNGQSTIPVTIFPVKLDKNKFNELKEEYKSHTELVGLWSDLRKGYDIFNETKQLPSIGFLSSGRHSIRK